LAQRSSSTTLLGSSTLEQLVLLAAFFVLRNRLQGLEGTGKVSCLTGGNLDRDDVTNGHEVFSSEATRRGQKLEELA